MDIMQVTRVNPQTLFAVPVSIETAGQIAALFLQLHEYGYTTTNQTGPDFPGGWRLVIKHTSGLADQVVYFGDWILVSDAAFDPSTNGWGVSRATQVSCYGRSTELSGTTADFVSIFTTETPLDWTATPEATLDDESGAVTLTFAQPVSPCGPFTYSVKGPGTADLFTPDGNGNISTLIKGLEDGEHSWTVAVSTKYKGVKGLSPASNSIAVASQ